MQMRMSRKVLATVVLAVVLGGGLLLAGNYAVTSYVIASAQRANMGPINPMVSGQPSSMMDQATMNNSDMMSMMGQSSMGSEMTDMMSMMQMCQRMMDMMGMEQQMMSSGMMTMRQGQKPLSLDQAVEKAQEHVQSLNNPDLVLAEVIEFDNHFYFVTKEKNAGVYAFESLMDKRTGFVHPAPGPNLTWSTKYAMPRTMEDMMGMGQGMMGSMSNGMMSSMMAGPTPIEPTADMPISPEQAKQIASRFLEKLATSMSQMPMMQMPMQPAPLQGAVPGEKVRKFYGYYTLDLLKDGKLAGLLSVNGYTGQVWHHAWNGNFVGMKEVEK
ncbi:hypothetical protein HYR54_06645 [Candidatus Acetothermia bacterium]|nr:hypothetical protein [Candidatus Acetothermia bacterium]